MQEARPATLSQARDAVKGATHPSVAVKWIADPCNVVYQVVMLSRDEYGPVVLFYFVWPRSYVP